MRAWEFHNIGSVTEGPQSFLTDEKNIPHKIQAFCRQNRGCSSTQKKLLGTHKQRQQKETKNENIRQKKHTTSILSMIKQKTKSTKQKMKNEKHKTKKTKTNNKQQDRNTTKMTNKKNKKRKNEKRKTKKITT